MRAGSLSRFTTVLTASLLLLAPCSMAELSTDPAELGSLGTIVMAIHDGPDPIGSFGWQQTRVIPAERILNASGADRGDGRPDIAFSADGKSVVTWAYWAGTDFDIAYSEWDGSAWTPVEFLTSFIDNEQDPRVFVASDGTVHVTWWTAGTTDQVFVATRETGSTLWSDPVQVSSEEAGGRRPSVAVFDGVLRVAYERDCGEPEFAQEIVVAYEQACDEFIEEVVGQTVRGERLDVILHMESGRLWVDWKQGIDLFGFAEHETTGWSSPGSETWTDPGWIGVESIRRVIRRNLISQ